MFRFMDRFSFYLRRQWNMSHFTVSTVMFIPLSAANVLMYEAVWSRTLYIAIVVLALWAVLTAARKHNIPANVPPVIERWIAFFIMGLDLIAMLTRAYDGDLLGVLRFGTDATMLMFWATPGYKVPYEPDNLNYAPGAA